MSEAALHTHDPLACAREWLIRDGHVALATVVSTWGSSPVPVGGQLAVRADGHFEGSVSGGCVESEVIATARQMIENGQSALLAFGVSNDTAWRAGLPCGGRIEVFVERLTRDDKAYLDAVLEARAERRFLIVEKNLTSAARQLYTDFDAVPACVTEARRTGKSALIEAEDGARLFLNVHAPAVRLVIVGATHIGQVLSDLARRIGCVIEIIDPRSAFASPERFADHARHPDWPETSLRTVKLDARSALVALTHVASIDDEALSVALRSDCFYIGALGSRKNHAARLARLAQLGFDDAQLSRVHGPVGLAIGAQGPEEIAVSILAQIISDLRNPP